MKVANIKLLKGSIHNEPKRIVIHAMGEFIDTENEDYSAHSLLAMYGLSAHVLVTPSGVVIRCSKDSSGAYHAKGHNTDTLGIEFLVPGLHTYESFLEEIKTNYLTSQAYESGMEQVRMWMEKYDIDKSNVVFHSDLSPGRKYDPGQGFLDSGFMDHL